MLKAVVGHSPKKFFCLSISYIHACWKFYRK